MLQPSRALALAAAIGALAPAGAALAGEWEIEVHGGAQLRRLRGARLIAVRPPIAGLATFEGSGVLTQVNVTLGVFLRF